MFKNLLINRIWKGYYMPTLLWLFVIAPIFGEIFDKKIINILLIADYIVYFIPILSIAITIEIMQKYINNYYIFIFSTMIIAFFYYEVDTYLFDFDYLYDFSNPFDVKHVRWWGMIMAPAIVSIFLKYKYNQEQKSLALQAKTDENNKSSLPEEEKK